MKANATQPNVIRTHALAELTSHGILFDTSGATATTVSGLGGIGAQNTSFSHCAPLFLETGCSIKYLPTAQVQAAIKLAKKRPHLHPIIKRPITAKLSAQKNEIQSVRDQKGGARGMELRKEGRAKMRPLNKPTTLNSI